MSQTPRKPSRPTRPPTSRPRRVAGQSRPASPDVEQDVDDEVVAEDAEAPDDVSVDLAKRSTDVTVAAAATTPAAPTSTPTLTATSTPTEPLRRGPLIGLAAAIVLLLVLGIGEVLYLRGVIGDDDSTPPQAPVSAERPVQLPDLDVRRVVDQAATAGDLILSASSPDYDAQVDKATATMTEPFAEQYRETKADVKDDFIAADTSVTIDISAQGVVSATDDEVVALLFLTQTTQKGTRGGVTPVQYRVTVTMVNTQDGWLVSDLEAL